MAPTKTTTLRLSTELRDEIARLASAHNSSMVDVVAQAIEELKRQHWWNDVQSSLNELDAGYVAEGRVLDTAAGDGLEP